MIILEKATEGLNFNPSVPFYAGVEKDDELAKKVVLAEGASKNISSPKEVTNQFMASYAILQKKS
jgi:hypothetical protein